MRPQDRTYAQSHEWCKIEDSVATIGITDFAVSHLQDLVFLDLPETGGTVTAGESFGEIESVKAVSDLYSPVSGTVLEVNSELPDNLDTLNADAFESGWMVRVQVTAQSPDLMDAAAYEEHIKALE